MLQTGRQVSSVTCKVKTLTCLKNKTEEAAKVKRYLLFLRVKEYEKSTWEVNLKLLFHLICHMQSYPSLNYLKTSSHEDMVIFLPLVNFTLLAFVLRAI